MITTSRRAQHHQQQRPLNIVQMVSSLNVGGMEYFVLRIAESLSRRGHNVTILALKSGPLKAQADALGLQAIVVNGNNKVQRTLSGVSTLARLKPDIIHAHNESILQYAALGKQIRGGGTKLVVTHHGHCQGYPRKPSQREWRMADAIVTVSDDVGKRIDVGPFRNKISTIYNGIDPMPVSRPRAEVRAELGISESAVVGIMLARMQPVKGHDTLLHALALLRKRAVPVLVLIAGDGPTREESEALARSLNLSASEVRFLGSRSDVANLLAAADFLTLPSRQEGFPIAILEAMSQGLPTVATPVGGTPELIYDKEHGLLVPVDDAQALADAMEKLVRDPDLRCTLGEAARRRVNSQLSFQQMTCQYESLFLRLCEKRAGVTAGVTA